MSPAKQENEPTSREILTRLDSLDVTIREAANTAQAWVAVLDRVIPESPKGWAFLVFLMLAPQIMGLGWAVAASTHARDTIIEEAHAIIP